MRGLWPDEMQVVIGENFGKARVLRQKTVTRMHGVGARDLAGRKQCRNVEITVFRGRRADADALVGKAHMHGVVVGGGMHRYSRDAKLLACAQDAQCDFATIGYQDLVEHLVLKAASREWGQRKNSLIDRSTRYSMLTTGPA